MSDTRSPPIQVQRLIHTICLPLSVRGNWRHDKDPVHLERIGWTLMENGVWKAGAAPGQQAGSPDPWDARRAYQARAYFHPFVRRFLFNDNLVRRFHRTDVRKVRALLGHWKTGDFAIELEVLRCELFVFQPDIAILRLELCHDAALDLDKVLVLLDRLRRMYPPYIESWQDSEAGQTVWVAGHCAQGVELLDADGNRMGSAEPMAKSEPATAESALFADKVEHLVSSKSTGAAGHKVFAHWRTLLAPLPLADQPGSSPLAAHLLGDDRAAILTWVALERIDGVSEGDWMRLCFADDPGTPGTLPYARSFTRDFEARFCYDRYWYQGRSVDNDTPRSRILNCGYAFTLAGSASDDSFFTNERNGAHAIFRHVYSDMAMVALFQKAALLAASQRLTELVERRNAGREIHLPSPAEVRSFYDHFIEFTQNFWFDEISPQEQGRELFVQWHEHLGTKPLYAEVRQELLDLVQYTELQTTGSLNRLVAMFGLASIVLSATAVVAAALALPGAFAFQALDAKLPLWVAGALLTAAISPLVLLIPAARARVWKHIPRRQRA